MEAPTAAKMETGVRGLGAGAAGNCSLAASSSASWRVKRELQVPAGGARGGGGAVLCVRQQEPEPEERGLLLLSGPCGLLNVTSLGLCLLVPERSAA